MDVRRLRYFSVLAHELHFRRAAEVLCIAQPGLSKQIQILESEIGARLFDRNSHGVTLTPAGRLLLEEGTPLLGQLERIAERVRATAAERPPTLRIVHTRSVTGGVPDEAVARYRLRHPDVDVLLDCAWTARNVAMLRSGEVDAAFVRLPLDRTDDLEVLTMGDTELVVVLPEGHPLARRRALDPSDLNGLPIVSWPRAQAPGYFDDLQARLWAGQSPARVMWEPDPEHVLEAVASGSGISVLDRQRALKLGPRGIVVRRFRVPVTGVFGVACTAHAADTPVSDFLDICHALTRTCHAGPGGR